MKDSHNYTRMHQFWRYLSWSNDSVQNTNLLVKVLTVGYNQAAKDCSTSWYLMWYLFILEDPNMSASEVEFSQLFFYQYHLNKLSS